MTTDAADDLSALADLDEPSPAAGSTPPEHDLAVDYAALHTLQRYHANPRRGDADAIAASLRKNGQYRPLVVNRGTLTGRPAEILAGNHTADGAELEGWHRVAVVWVDVDDAAAARIVAADNRTADLGGYDDAVLLELLHGLPDLEGTGYDDDALRALEQAVADEAAAAGGGGGDTDPDDVPEPPTEPVSQVGDVWHLGPHRLVVGDARHADTWTALLDGEQANAMWTDPPYGVSYVGGTTDALRIENDELTGEAMVAFLRDGLGHALTATRPGGCWYVASPPGPPMAAFVTVLTALEVWHQTLVWLKDSAVMTYADYHPRYEIIFYGWRPGAAHHRLLDRTQDNVHEVPRPRRSEEHPTMKPVELIARHLRNSTDAHDVVLDPYAGSGSTLIACHQLGRSARLIEVDPHYADVICRRYQEHTGGLPVRDGETVDFSDGGHEG